MDLVYLDALDYSSDPASQKASREHHLAETKAIEHRLHTQSVILIDDCDLPGRGKGKGKLASAYVQQKGWNTIQRIIECFNLAGVSSGLKCYM